MDFLTLTIALDKLCRLMPSDLPQTINPLRLARAGALLNGRLNIGDMERLASLLNEPQGQVDFELRFFQDAEGISYITGQSSATVTLQCQRCFGPMSEFIEAQTRLIIVASTEAAREIPDDYEPLLFTGENIVLSSLIEDEILLSLPIAPLHDTDKCNVRAGQLTMEKETSNPFDVLKNLKTYTQE